jgi:DNA-binding NarL/FixJ family response regulator
MIAVIVDDSVIVQRRVADLLRELAGVDAVFQAADGVSALAVVDQHHPDLVVLDIHMPSLDGNHFDGGMDVLKAIKSAANPPAVIMLSNFSEPIYRIHCAQLGADAFLDKSNEFDKLITVAQLLLDSRSAAKI